MEMKNKLFTEGFFEREGPRWDAVGTKGFNVTKCSDAVIKAKLNYNIVLAPASGLLNGKHVAVPNKTVIFREPTKDDPEPRFFGFASPDYPIIQNIDVAKHLDVLTDDWPVHSVGELDFGKTIFFTLSAGNHKIKGDDLELYFLVTDKRDGGTSMKMAFTPVRLKCWNMLTSAIRKSIVSVPLNHLTGIDNAFKSRVNLVKQLKSVMGGTLNVFSAMGDYKMKKAEIDDVLAITYPLPNKPKSAGFLEDGLTSTERAVIGKLYDDASDANDLWQYYCERALNLRSAVVELYEKFNSESPRATRTGWALYNAVVELADFRKGGESAAASTMFGARAEEKKRAFTAIASNLS